MARPMTPAEKTAYSAAFPALNVNNAVVTGEATPVYNCLAWTLGITNAWVWPGKNEADFDRLYNGAGFVRAANGPIAAWGYSAGEMTHGSISGPGHGPRWESKCGQGLRFQHGLTELETAPNVGAKYGKVRYFYAPRRRTLASLVATIIARLRMQSLSKQIPESYRAAVAQAAANLHPGIREEFMQHYRQWREGWSSEAIALSSDPAVVRSLPGFEELRSMGPEIVPLVMERLLKPEEFFALQLYDVLHGDGVSAEAMPVEYLFGGEQLRARLTVEAWLAGRARRGLAT